MASLTPELLVEDIDKTVLWYRTLGFELLFKAPETGTPAFARIKRGGAEIMLNRRVEFAADVPSFASSPMGGSLVLYIETKDLQLFYANVQNKVKVVKPLHTTDYGTKEFILQDLNGYYLLFGERK